jgi:hypothetical protein
MTEEDFKRKVAEAKARYDAMTPEQQAEMWRRQREGYARAEASWPKPKFKMVDGVKVYDSMEDYHNG